MSPDPVQSHSRFAKKINLNYSILADPERKLIDPLGVWVEKEMYGKSYFGVERSTFLIDENGKVIKIWRKVKADGHAKEVLKVLSAEG